jgi:acetyltransferase-like isoleucine patch superfamily enzyme
MKKNLFRRVSNRLLHGLARVCPGSFTFRPFLHKLRGVGISKSVFIGDDVYIENEYPEHVELHEGAVLSIRSIIIAHTRGPGRVIIERNALIGPGAMVVCQSGKTLRVGEGAVVSTGSVITSSVAPGMIVAPPKSVPVGKARIPFPLAKTIEEFVSGMEPLRRSKAAERPSPSASSLHS